MRVARLVMTSFFLDSVRGSFSFVMAKAMRARTMVFVIKNGNLNGANKDKPVETRATAKRGKESDLSITLFLIAHDRNRELSYSSC